MNLPLIPQDKANHLIYGLAIYALSCLFLDGMLPFFITLLFATGKEIKDYISYGKFDFLDLLFTILPSIIYELFKLISNG